MGLITTWTDLESGSGEMPASIFGQSHIEGADRIGLYVEFENGLSGSVTYSGVAGLWNSIFTGITAESATGFFTNAVGLHMLYNVGTTLPMAWEDFSMPFSGNFDLDYNNALGSHFRANVAGWGSATFATYSSTAPVPEPSGALLAGLGVLGLVARRRR